MPVGSVDSIGGNLDGVDFDVFCMKEPDYVMMLMSTYGTNIRMGEHKNRDGVEAFQYPEVVHNHYQYRHQIDDHNNKRHPQPISLEVTWATKTWENRVFAYLLASYTNLGGCCLWELLDVYRGGDGTGVTFIRAVSYIRVPEGDQHITPLIITTLTVTVITLQIVHTYPES